jgi:hypothetical protein
MHHGLPVRKSVASENPMSGSGPSESARSEREQTVEGVRNPEDGRCRESGISRVIRAPGIVERCRGRNPRRGALTIALVGAVEEWT